MNREIEEMARTACVGMHEGDCEHCPRRGFCSSYTVSRKLYNKGYRKSTDVAREIFAEIEKNLVTIDNFGINQFRCIGARIFAELRKKYESEGADDE